MPRRTLPCDYCDKSYSKHELPVHIKAKHMDNLRRFLVEEAKESQLSTILSFMKGNYYVSIPSKEDDVHYWFGSKPIAVEEKDDIGDYMRLPANQEAHKAFLQEVMSGISIVDYITIQREAIIRSQKMIDLQKTVEEQAKQLKHLQEEYSAYKETTTKTIQSLQETVDAMNDGETMDSLRSELQKKDKTIQAKEKDIRTLHNNVAFLEYELSRRNTPEEERVKVLELEGEFLALKEKYQKVLGQLEEEKSKNKAIKDKRKEKERSSLKAKKEKAKIKEQMKELKRKQRKLKKTISDSDSDSDDDSSASSCDDD